MRRTTCLGAAALALLVALPAAGAPRGKYDYDALGAEFCRLTLAGDMAGLRPLISDDLARTIEAAAARTELLPPQQLFQSYTNVVPECEAHTRNAAIVEIRRKRGAPRRPGANTSSSCRSSTAPPRRRRPLRHPRSDTLGAARRHAAGVGTVTNRLRTD